ncbi:MAG: S8/S53 family peptidase [Rhodocyclaceae bacterium]|nr:S8/S53 family peptidase [Rhodocyclaceae bacterium]
MTDKPVSTKVLLVRLAPGDTPAALQARIEAAAGPVAGELLCWLDGPWCYLPGGHQELLATRRADRDVSGLVLAAGAAEVRTAGFREFAARLAARSEIPGFLRDAGASGVAPPGVVGDTARVAGRTVALDWQLTVAGIDKAWALFDPSPGLLPWREIRVGHIDTGCTRHPALGFADPGGDVSDFVRPDLGLNLFQPPPPDDGRPDFRPPEEDGPFDNLSGPNGGHGTSTLSVLAGFYDTPDDSEPPFHGAAPGAAVIPYRVTDSVLIDAVQRSVAAAIDHAVGQGCRVISMSLGGIVPFRRLSDAIDRAYEAGVIVCAAAGNVIREVTYPGRYNRVVTVGGVRPDGNPGDAFRFAPWDGASRGVFVDVCGPADGIRRARARRDADFEYFISGQGSGTSYATALCAGIAVLWLARRGAELRAAYGPPGWRWPAACKRLLMETADRPGGWDTANWGRGAYRADRLLAAALPAAASLVREAPAADPVDLSVIP